VAGERGSLRRRALVAAYVVLATIAVLGTVEWLARRRSAFGYRRAASPGIVYELRPEYPDHNPTGHRDHAYAREKRPGVFRVIGIGDSYSYGAGVPREDVFLKVAERMLRQDGGPEVEVLNFGVPGYNTAMEAAVFAERTPGWDPDLVVVQFCRNDFNLPNFVWTTGNALVARSYALHELLTGLAGRWPAFVKKDVMGYFFDEEVFPVPGLEHVAKRGHNPIGDPARAPERYRYMLGPEGVRAALARIAAEARRRRVPVIFLLGWAGHDLDAAEWAAGEGLEVLDVWSPVAIRFVSAGGRFEDLWVAPEQHDNHPNVEGHAVIGAALADAIRPHLPVLR